MSSRALFDRRRRYPSEDILIIVFLLAVLLILKHGIGATLHGAAALRPVCSNGGSVHVSIEEALVDNFQESLSSKKK